MTKVRITIPGHTANYIGKGKDIYEAINDLPYSIYPAVYDGASSLVYAHLGKQRWEDAPYHVLVTLATAHLPEALEALCKQCGWTLVIEEV